MNHDLADDEAAAITKTSPTSPGGSLSAYQPMPKPENNQVPNSLNDPVLALISEYFFPCEVLHDRLHEVKEQFFEVETREAVSKQFWTYLNHWLSSLWVVAHGFRHVLKLEDKRINERIDANFKKLSDFRNATYHYHRSPAKHKQFFGAGGNNMNWAEDLHAELERYFQDYLAGLDWFYGEEISDRE
jgi:hypothetical protein